jgi:ubiquinone/menaquinone biosynthesis C-methylase UbiE
MEKLPFANQSFDIIVSAGSLSYGDNDIVMNEIYRVLKLQGVFIAIDSLNNNNIRTTKPTDTFLIISKRLKNPIL